MSLHLLDSIVKTFEENMSHSFIKRLYNNGNIWNFKSLKLPLLGYSQIICCKCERCLNNKPI